MNWTGFHIPFLIPASYARLRSSNIEYGTVLGLQKIGFDLVITNAYITRNNYGDKAVQKGIHKIIDFNGAVMTDSGGYQVLEYGGVDVSPEEMAEFETGIKTDIAIPLDKPTGYGLAKNKARAYVEHTLKVSKKTLEIGRAHV